MERLVVAELERLQQDKGISQLNEFVKEQIMKILNYIYRATEEIKIENEYYFGQLWDGEEGNATEILESGAVAIIDGDSEEKFCDFEITQNDADFLNHSESNRYDKKGD